MSTINLITVDNASVSFSMGRSVMDFMARKDGLVLKAVNQVSISLAQGETLGVVGESGCGKSTFGRALIGLQELSGGSIKYRGRDIAEFTVEEKSEFRQNVQMIFQEPVGALNPRMTIGDAIAEVLSVHKICPKSEIESRTLQLLDTVGLPAYLASRKPRGLSGGQCQRVGIARCLAVNPTLIIADEAVSALDVSVQAQVLNLLTELQKKNNLSMVFISHDLTVVRHVCKRVCVMYMGRVVEIGETKEIFETPRHPYTKALIAAKPKSGGGKMTEVMLLDNEPPSPLNLPSGCAFRTRCPKSSEICAKKLPEYAAFGNTEVACHLFT